MADCEILGARMTEIDTYHELDQEETNKLHLKHALYRIKACLLLKGKPVDELDDVAFEHKYPPKFIVENNYFFHYVQDGFFGWYFDTDLCYKKYLNDYQRLVLLNDDLWTVKAKPSDQEGLRWMENKLREMYAAVRPETTS